MAILRLTSRSGVEYLARLVYGGERYGAGRRLVSTDFRPLVEFVVPRGHAEQFVAAQPADELASVHEGFAPGRMPGLALDAHEAERLCRWVEDPRSVEDAVVLLVGDEDELHRAALALAQLRLEPRYEADGVRALDRLRRLPPPLVVVGEHVRQLEPLELVRRIRRAGETHDLPVVVLGGDAAEARAAGASAHFDAQPDHKALVAAAAELLELV